MKYHRLPNYKNGNPTVHHIIIACSTDGRLRVFVNEKANEYGQINEEEEFEDYEGVEEVPYRDSDDSEDFLERDQELLDHLEDCEKDMTEELTAGAVDARNQARNIDVNLVDKQVAFPVGKIKVDLRRVV